jgi:glycine cleavage system T protein (aminomethyltransferase)
VNAANVAKDEAHVRRHLAKEVGFVDRSADTALIAIQGPRAADILAKVAGGSVAALQPFGVKTGRAAGAEATVARTGYTGEDGFEVFVANADAVRVWQALLVAGHGEGLVPVGLGARDTLRLEARFSLYGNDIDETTGPIEAGLGWTCKLDKDFTGRDAIAKQKADGPARRIVGLVVEGGVARHGYEVVADGKVVGQVTSGTYGPTVAQNIALAYVPTALAKVGTALAVRIRGKDVPATVVKTPFYKRAP